jgi:hypothetical protein
MQLSMPFHNAERILVSLGGRKMRQPKSEKGELNSCRSGKITKICIMLHAL